jgi:hypothetical protein
MDVFSYKPKKQPKVIRRKLGKERAWGQSGKLIEIDARLTGKKELIIYLHEYYHYIFPRMTEDEIIIASESTADFLWRNHYRRVDNSEG